MDDFNNTNITLIFEPDEDGTPMNERSAPVPIVDDAINEATEQVFIVELRLVSSLDPARVDLSTRPSSLCKITDNDRKYMARNTTINVCNVTLYNILVSVDPIKVLL